jgi:hypothetical protein
VESTPNPKKEVSPLKNSAFASKPKKMSVDFVTELIITVLKYQT